MKYFLIAGLVIAMAVLGLQLKSNRDKAKVLIDKAHYVNPAAKDALQYEEEDKGLTF